MTFLSVFWRVLGCLTFCLPWNDNLFLLVSLTPAKWPETISPWCHDDKRWDSFSVATLVAYGFAENLTVWGLLVSDKQFRPHFKCQFPNTNQIICTLCWDFHLFFGVKKTSDPQAVYRQVVSIELTTF